MFNSIRFYCSLPSWVAGVCSKIDRHTKRINNVMYVPYDFVEETIKKEFKRDQEQHAAYYAEFMHHLDSLYKRDRVEYAGVLTGLFLGGAYRAVDDELIELIRKNQQEHIRELNIND